MRNLLASVWGRRIAFFLLYITEGIPLGFTATVIATQMRRQGVGPAAIGAFVASLYLPGNGWQDPSSIWCIRSGWEGGAPGSLAVSS